MNPHVLNTVLKRATVGLVTCLLLVACGGGNSAPEEPRVSILYAVAQDGAERDTATLDSALKTVQTWYKTQLGGPTFVANSVVSCTLPNIADYYATDSYDKVLADIATCDNVELDDPDTRWLIYADVIHECATPGGLGLTNTGRSIFSRLELDGLSERGYADDCGARYERSPAFYQGQMAHELGRSLGLVNPTGCLEDDPSCDDEALMFSGHTQFPDTYLTVEDKAELLKTRFIR